MSSARPPMAISEMSQCEVSRSSRRSSGASPTPPLTRQRTPSGTRTAAASDSPRSTTSSARPAPSREPRRARRGGRAGSADPGVHVVRPLGGGYGMDAGGRGEPRMPFQAFALASVPAAMQPDATARRVGRRAGEECLRRARPGRRRRRAAGAGVTGALGTRASGGGDDRGGDDAGGDPGRPRTGTGRVCSRSFTSGAGEGGTGGAPGVGKAAGPDRAVGAGLITVRGRAEGERKGTGGSTTGRNRSGSGAATVGLGLGPVAGARGEPLRARGPATSAPSPGATPFRRRVRRPRPRSAPSCWSRAVPPGGVITSMPGVAVTGVPGDPPGAAGAEVLPARPGVGGGPSAADDADGPPGTDGARSGRAGARPSNRSIGGLVPVAAFVALLGAMVIGVLAVEAHARDARVRPLPGDRICHRSGAAGVPEVRDADVARPARAARPRVSPTAGRGEAEVRVAVRAVRGATRVDVDEREHILTATRELVGEILDRNELEPQDVVSVVFTATRDLTAVAPALAAPPARPARRRSHLCAGDVGGGVDGARRPAARPHRDRRPRDEPSSTSTCAAPRCCGATCRRSRTTGRRVSLDPAGRARARHGPRRRDRPAGGERRPRAVGVRGAGAARGRVAHRPRAGPGRRRGRPGPAGTRAGRPRRRRRAARRHRGGRRSMSSRRTRTPSSPTSPGQGGRARGATASGADLRELRRRAPDGRPGAVRGRRRPG